MYSIRLRSSFKDEENEHLPKYDMINLSINHKDGVRDGGLNLNQTKLLR